MAGRVPDRSLWRLRDWLACGAGTALRTALPRMLIRHRVGVTEDERALLRTAVLGWGGSSRMVDAVLHTDDVTGAAAAALFTFGADGARPGWDATDLVLAGLVSTGEVRELRRAWRRDSLGASGRAPARIVLARAGEGVDDVAEGPPALTGLLQRVLRAHGDAEPRVEVLTADGPVTGYHEAALAGSEVLGGVGGTVPRGSGGRRGAGELVGHG